MSFEVKQALKQVLVSTIQGDEEQAQHHFNSALSLKMQDRLSDHQPLPEVSIEDQDE
jgi:hypothetical protein